MELLTVLSFMSISLGVIAMPGPNVLVVVSTSIRDGNRRSSQTIVGISVAMGIQLVVAATGASWLVDAFVSGFDTLRWTGVAYLVYLAIRQFIEAGNRSASIKTLTALGSFTRGFVVSLTNAKTILFFGAFLPQFVNPAISFSMQIAVLSATFWFLALLVNVSYMVLAGKLSTHLNSARASGLVNIASGSLYLAAAAFLSAVKRWSLDLF